jgi:tungstate transport system ATP-binding protein
LSTVLEIRDLLIRRGKSIVVEVDHLVVEQGEVLAIIGPNGAGKSSLLLAVARLLKPERGSILFNGFKITNSSDTEYRRHLGLVLQEPLLLDTSVFENVATGLRFRHTPRPEIQLRTETWLKRLGIEHLRKRQARKLSGGEAQRVSLARAFALQPDLLLLDEPFSALDAPTRLRLLDDLHAILSETDTTTLFITHDLKEAARLGDSMAVILNGRLHQRGTPDEIYSNPKDEDVRAFLGLAVKESET